MRKLGLIFLAVVPFTVGACDTIKARSRAQDGVNFYKDGEAQKAAEKFEEANKFDATIPTIWLNLGFAELAVYQSNTRAIGGQVAATKAIAAFEKYLEMRPGEERAKSYLVQTFVDTGRYDDAVKFYQPSVDRDPPDTQALATLGTIASKVGQYDNAVMWYQRRIKADPTNSDAHLNLGIQLWDHMKGNTSIVGKDRIDLANNTLATLKDAIKYAPGAPNPYLYTNLAYRERSNAKLSEDQTNADLQLANDYFIMANNVGKKEDDPAKAKAAQAAFDKAKADAAVNEPKADALVTAGLAALPPPVDPNAPPPPEPKGKGKKKGKK